jgi:hypothetical protein
MEKLVKKLGFITGTVSVAVIFLAVGPLLAIWAINTLFVGIDIPFTFSTWFATFMLMIMFGNKGKSNESKY